MNKYTLFNRLKYFSRFCPAGALKRNQNPDQFIFQQLKAGKEPTGANKTGVLLSGDDSGQNRKSEKKIKKTPAIMAGEDRDVSMARKTGILCYWLLLVLLTACSDEADCKFENWRSSFSRRW